MKKTLTLLGVFLLFFCANIFAQNINFQSNYFKNFLLTKSSDLVAGSHSPEIIDINGDGEINEIEASLITSINVYILSPSADIYNINNDLTKFINLETFIIQRPSNGPIGSLSSLDLSQNTKLKKLFIYDMSLTSLDVSNNLALEDLILTFNSLTNIDISNNKQLTRLIVSYNKTSLNNIDFSNNLKLESLTLNDVQITAIDVTKNGLLKTLNIDNNPITELNILNNCNLSQLICLNTLVETIDARNCKLGRVQLGNTEQEGLPLVSSTLKKVYLTGQPFTTNWFDGYDFEFFQCGNLDFICIDPEFVELTTRQMNNDPTLNHTGYSGNNTNCTVTSSCDIPQVAGNCNTQTCPIINFPDINFKNALLNHSPVIDTDGDGEICIEEAESATKMYLFEKNISDFTGLEYFLNIDIFISHKNLSKNIDLSSNTKLKYVYVRHHPLESINVTNNILLEELEVSDCGLNSLDIKNNINLKTLLAHGNELTEIDISNNSSLTKVNLHKNKLSNFNITPNNSGLKSITLTYNQIKEIDIRNCTSVNTIAIAQNPLLEKAFLTGNHTFYDSPGSYVSFAGAVNCPNLKFVCVNNVSFFETIKELHTVTWGNPDCTVSTDCSLSNVVTPSFDMYFSIGPNPAKNYIYLYKDNPKITATKADIYDANFGNFIKSVNLVFNNELLEPIDDPKKTLQTFEPIESNDSFNIENSAYIDLGDLNIGYYILKVHTSKGILSTRFYKSTNAIR